MQITLNQDEILSAIDTYVRTQINVQEGQTIEIDLKAGRGENGFSATLDIVPANRNAAPAEDPKPVTKVTKTKSEPEVEVEEVKEQASEPETAADDSAGDEKPAPAATSIFSKAS